MSTPSSVTNASARLTMESVNRLIEMEITSATLKLRGETESLRRTVRDMEAKMTAMRNRSAIRSHRDGKMMVVIGIGCSIAGLMYGYWLRGAL